MEQPFQTIIEPFRIHSVEPIRVTTRAHARDPPSGSRGTTCSASTPTTSSSTCSPTPGPAPCRRSSGRESSAATSRTRGRPSFFRFRDAVTEPVPVPRTCCRPTRVEPRSGSCSPVVGGPGQVIPNNTHFDTTRANVEATGAEARRPPDPRRAAAGAAPPVQGQHGRGRLGRTPRESRATHVPVVMLTVTNNSGGGQPVSMENIRAVRQVCDRFGDAALSRRLPLRRECLVHQDPRARLRDRAVADIVREMASPRRRHDDVGQEGSAGEHRRVAGAQRRRRSPSGAGGLEILTEGFPTYGGLAGRDLEAIAQGLTECVDEDYLRYRIRSIEYLGEALEDAGVPVVVPVRRPRRLPRRAGACCPTSPRCSTPARSLACALYLEGGVRSPARSAP